MSSEIANSHFGTRYNISSPAIMVPRYKICREFTKSQMFLPLFSDYMTVGELKASVCDQIQ